MNHPSSPFLLLLLLHSLSFLPPTTPRFVNPPNYNSPPYSPHCSPILPEPIPNPTKQPLNPNNNNNNSPSPYSLRHLPSFSSSYTSPSSHSLFPNSPLLKPLPPISSTLSPLSSHPTSHPSLISLSASLSLRITSTGPHPFPTGLAHGLNIRGGPNFRLGPRLVRFKLSGYWDISTGQLCMVGSAIKRAALHGNNIINNNNVMQYDAMFTSVYPNSSDIHTSLVKATLVSLSPKESEGHFEKIEILGFSRTGYNYTLLPRRESGVHEGDAGNGTVEWPGSRSRYRQCYQFRSLSENFEIVEGKECGEGRECRGFDARYMSFNEIDCSDERMVRVAFGFANESGSVRNGYRQGMDPRRTLVAEGMWDEGMNKLELVACRIMNFTEGGSLLSAVVGDCSVRLSFSFRAVVSIRTSSVIDGSIWSNKSVGEEGYFDRSEIRAAGSQRAALPFMKYEYTEVERAKRYCGEKKVFKKKGGVYPDTFSNDMKFDVEVKNSKGQGAWGKAHPVFVGERFVEDVYPYMYRSALPEINPGLNGNNTSQVSLVNVTYLITFSPKDTLKVGGRSLMSNETLRLSAEGVYDTETGRLCMVGCWKRETEGKTQLNATNLDCDIFISIQLPPTNLKAGEVVKGNIESRREKADPLYFERLDLSATSLTTSQISSAFWRMDFEITMVLVSNTLICIFVGLQLFYVKKHPDVLPFVSVVMVLIITLGHMIPLLLNMEALFLTSPQKKTVLFGSGGWLEVNEVLVRVITMVAFLLEFRLLQLTWSSRGDEGTLKSLWGSEKKVILYSLPLHACGVLIAWLVQRSRAPSRRIPFQFQNQYARSNPSLPFWHEVKTYAGFMLDAFLLPQMTFNVFSDSKSMALSFPYYFGTTIVRLMPHLYDVYRAHSSARYNDVWYIYANPERNFFSTAWDILVSCLGLLFVMLIYLQQRYGGRWILPKRFREVVSYEKVPTGL